MSREWEKMLAVYAQRWRGQGGDEILKTAFQAAVYRERGWSWRKQMWAAWRCRNGSHWRPLRPEYPCPWCGSPGCNYEGGT